MRAIDGEYSSAKVEGSRMNSNMTTSELDCSVIIPTRNRRKVLAATLERLAVLPDRGYEIIVIDNGSADGTQALAERFPEVHWIELDRNLGSAARNVGAATARGRVLFMLDDDSWPAPHTIDEAVALFDERDDLGAIACRVRLADPPHRHDAGGVPGIFFNCGGAIRKEAFIEAGGFPLDFDYYAEEYDLCCRLWQRGWRVEPHGDLLVWHARVTKNRDNHNMLRLLVRNNLRLWQRYAPPDELVGLIQSTVERYLRVAVKENALEGYLAGLAEGRAEIAAGVIRKTPLTNEQLARLFGLDVAEASLREWADNARAEKIAIWSRGKGCEQLIRLIDSASIAVDAVYDRHGEGSTWMGRSLRNEEAFEPGAVDGIVVGTLSPGVAEDLQRELVERFPDMSVLSAAPWMNVPAPSPVLIGG
jgi:GT2 family glycosyltransferase